MGEQTKISWTDSTFSPWIGCQRVSPGCENCYAEALDKRVGGGIDPSDGVKKTRWGPSAPRIRTSAANWKKPIAWNRAAAKLQKRHLVFCSSLADVFEDREELIPWRRDLFELIDATPALTWLLLTKRPENIAPMAPPRWAQMWLGGEFPRNVWLGTTVEDRLRAAKRLPFLLEIPAAVHFVSAEPLLEDIDLAPWMWPTRWHWDAGFATPEAALAGGGWAKKKPQSLVSAGRNFIDWLIVGGESGGGARKFDLAWARKLREQATESGHTVFFMKQKGVYVEDDGKPVGCIGKGDDVSAFPEDLRLQAFPTARAT